MNPEPPSYEAKENEPIVIVGGQRYNVSNLYVTKKKPARDLNPLRSPRREEPSLYPSLSDLPTVDTSTDAIFARVESRGSRGLNGKHSSSSDQYSVDKNESKEQKTLDDDSKVIEVTPGCVVTLRGAKETLQSIKQGNITSVTCVCCNLSLVVVKTASLVMCPECNMISPLDGGDGSLGLGLREKSMLEELEEDWDLEEEEESERKDEVAMEDGNLPLRKLTPTQQSGRMNDFSFVPDRATS